MTKCDCGMRSVGGPCRPYCSRVKADPTCEGSSPLRPMYEALTRNAHLHDGEDSALIDVVTVSAFVKREGVWTRPWSCVRGSDARRLLDAIGSPPHDPPRLDALHEVASLVRGALGIGDDEELRGPCVTLGEPVKWPLDSLSAAGVGLSLEARYWAQGGDRLALFRGHEPDECLRRLKMLRESCPNCGAPRG